MSKRISDDVSGKIETIMFTNFGDSDAEHFLRKELVRYVPQFTGWKDDEILRFIEYQRDIWLKASMPEFGIPIACLNPTFVDSIDGIHVTSQGLEVYTRAAVKENGYRFQLHNPADPSKACAFTRQFTSYDLRMLPELAKLYEVLPVMIGDAELINKRHIHLAGFNRVNRRIPDMRYWPRKGTSTIEDELLAGYLADESMFVGKMPIDEYELTLAFHGMFAIAHPETWNSSREVQTTNMISFCSLPMNYRKVDLMLDQLSAFMHEKETDARVVERKVVKTKPELAEIVRQNDDAGLEGTVVVQYAEDEEKKPSFKVGKSIKIKKYETIDTVLLGVYLSSKAEGLVEGNIEGALLGLYDDRLDKYMPVCKVNLDPEGVQIKTQGQRDRLTELRKALVIELQGKEDPEGKIVTLYDAYLEQGRAKLTIALENNAQTLSRKTRGVAVKINPESIERMFDTIPRGADFHDLVEEYNAHKHEYDAGTLGAKKSSPKKESWVAEHKGILSEILWLKYQDRKAYRNIMKYFAKAPEIKAVSKKLAKPSYVASTAEPVIVETQVFQVEWGINQYAAGFHTWYCNSFRFNNCFAEHIRHDKSTTTDYATIYALARKNTVRR